MMKWLAVCLALGSVLLASCRRQEPTSSHPVAKFRSADSAAPTLTQPARKSPHETISLLLDGNRVTVVYGRPYTNDPVTGLPRQIWGELVPYGKYFRFGADEATLFITQQSLVLGGVRVPAGAYSLFFVLNADESATLLVNQEIGQWGIDPYRPEREIARVTLKPEPLDPPIHQFTIVLDRAPTRGGLMKLMWENRQYTLSYTVAGGVTSQLKPASALHSSSLATLGAKRRGIE